jgi:putative CocE/NonD family hydrolase
VTGASALRWALGKLLGLPPRLTGKVELETGLRCAMRDGIELIADRFHAPEFPKAPVVLMRSPYGRGAMFGVMAGLMAERGLQVVVQSVRGVSGSGGRFDPMRQERADGADTVDWLKTQPWFGGTLFTNSMSYLGNVQWAMAMDRAEAIHGMALGMTLSNFADELRAGGGGLTLRGMLSWTQTMRLVAAEGGRGARRRQPKLDPHFEHLPIGTIDSAAFGEPVPHWQEWMAHEDAEDPFWQAMDYSPGVTRATAPAMMVAGWRDIFLPFQLKDFAARQTAGLETWLTIGPWQHASPRGMIAGLKEAIHGFPRIAKGEPPLTGRDKVQIYVEGAKQWRDYPTWPPPSGAELRLQLCADGALAPKPGAAGVSAYTYDPNDPTPAVHGPALMGGKRVRDMAALEARKDIASFTSAPTDAAFEAIGPVAVELAVRSDREHTDFYATLCDVDPRGRSLQVCDGYIRLSPGKPEGDQAGVRRIAIECWPIAWRFAKGHRLRVTIASGAFPRFARNPGTGEPFATATRLVPAQQEVLHGPEAGSALVLQISQVT